MPTPDNDLDQEKKRHEQELKIWRQIAFASGLFLGDVTVRTLLESLPVGCIILDDTGTILLVNNRTEQMFGYAKEDLMGKPHAVLIPERFRKVHEEHMARFFAEPAAMPMHRSLDVTGLRRDESEFPVEIDLGSIETVNGVHFMAFVSDITLRKQFERRLRESEELFHLQIEQVRDYAIFTIDPQGIVLNWNAGAERLKGYRAEEIIGRHFSCFYSEEDRHAGKPEAEIKTAAGEGQVGDEGWRIRKDGSRFWADVTITVLHDESGNLLGFSKVTHDITERKRVEEELKENERAKSELLDKLNQAQLLAVIGSWDWDLRTDRFWWSDETYRIFGVTQQDFVPSFEANSKFIHPDDVASYRTAFESALQTGKPLDLDIRLVIRDGQLKHCNAKGTVHHDVSGQPICFAGTVMDITERKQAEEALRRSEELLLVTLSNIPSPVFITDSDDNFTFICPNAPIILGYSMDEIQKMGNISKIVGNDLFSLEELEKRGVIANIERMVTDNFGRHRTFLTTVKQVSIGEGTRLYVMHDITERKQMEQEVAWLASFPMLNPHPIVEVDINGRVSFANPTAERLFPELKHHGPSHPYLEDWELLASSLRCGTKPNDRMVVVEGRWYLQTMHYMPGQLFRIYGFDITKRKLAEEELRESEQKYRELNETLEQRINEAVEDLQNKNRLLIIQGRQAVMGEMIGNIAHQWRQPLNTLGLLAQELQVVYKRGESSTEYVDDNVKRTMETIQNMSKTIDVFTTFFQSDKVKVNFNVHEVIDKAMSLLVAAFKPHGIRSEIEVTGDPFINGYPNEFAQVILNIVNNAKDALLAANVDSPTITIRSCTEGGKTIMTISDNAGGIPEGILDKIFEPYFTTKGPDKGTGIGLYISKTIIETHMNGTLTVCNVGAGAEFRIEI